MDPGITTIARWMNEGMTTSDYVSYFDLDKIGRINIDYSPRYPRGSAGRNAKVYHSHHGLGRHAEDLAASDLYAGVFGF